MTCRLPMLTVLLLTISSPAATAQAPAGDVGLLAQWLTGEFDNFQQYYEAKDTKAPVLYDRVHVVISPLTGPAIGTRVLLARESALNDPDRVSQLHVYGLAAGAAGTVELRLFTIDDKAALAAALKDPAALASVPPDRLKPVSGCVVTWRRDGDVFTGALKPGACEVTLPSSGVRATLEIAYRLSADELWFSERATDAAGTLVFGRQDGAPFKLKRARQFSCYAALRKEGTTDQYDSMLNVAVHDQGKWVTIVDGAGAPTKYSFELSQLRYSQQQPVMKLALYEAGKDQAFVYTWADTTGLRIGINLRWIQVGCKPK